METARSTNSDSAPGLPRVIARYLRHEVGDLLQMIYVSVARLQEHLPAESEVERSVLANLRARAEECKHVLDDVHDFVFPVTLVHEPVDLAELSALVVARASARYPRVAIRAEAVAAPQVLADPSRLAQLGRILLANACRAADKCVVLRTAPGNSSREVEWIVTDDGPGVSAQAMDKLFDPQGTEESVRMGLDLALARKLVLLHGGRIAAANLAEGGLRLTVTLPASP